MTEYFDYGQPLKELNKQEVTLKFALYHLIFGTEKILDSYSGHSKEDWEHYKATGSPDLITELHDTLDWAHDRSNYDFNDLIRPAAGPVKNERIYKYIYDFRSSIEKYRTS